MCPCLQLDQKGNIIFRVGPAPFIVTKINLFSASDDNDVNLSIQTGDSGLKVTDEGQVVYGPISEPQ